MTTRVPIRYGGTGANTAAAARTALGAAPTEAYDVANSAYAQANAAYSAANNAQVTVYANNASNVTTQNVNFVNTATVSVTVTADGSNANIEFTAASQTVVNDTYTAAGNTSAAATANIANGLYAIATSAYDAANNRVLTAGDTMTGALNITATNVGLNVSNSVVISNTFGGLNSGILVNKTRFFAFSNTGENSGHPTFRTEVANSRTVLRVLPSGTPTTNSKTQFEFFAEDYFTTPSDWHNFRIIATNNNFFIDTSRANNSVAPRTINFNIGGSGEPGTANYANVLVVSTGNVGVNIGDPTSNLHVVGTANITSNVIVDNGTLFVDSVNDRVGIGTITPLEPLTVQGNVRINNGGVLKLLTTTAAERGTIYATQSTGALTAGLVIETSGDEEIVFKDAGEINMVIQGSGASGNGSSNVGIGISAPTSKLHVVGNANITAGINTTTVNATTVNAQTFVTSTGVNVFDTATNAYIQANAAYGQANLAYSQANSAYAEANLKLNLTGGTIAGSLNISGNLTITGNTKYVNVETYIVTDPLIYLAANNDTSDLVDIGFMGGKNTAGQYSHTGLIRHAGDQKYYLFDNLAEEGHVNNVVDVANTTLATLKANIEANSIVLVGNTVATQANLTLAYNQANSAFAAANNRVLKAGDTMTGALTLSLANSTSISFQEQAGYGVIEIGGNSGAFIDMKAPASDDFDFRIQTRSNSNTQISTNGTDKQIEILSNTSFDSGILFVDAVNDRVGVGTTTPVSKFEVSGSTPKIAITNAGTRRYTLGVTSTNFIITDESASAERIRIDQNGNLGIGSDSPDNKLDVQFDGTSTTLNAGPGTSVNTGARIYNSNTTTDTYSYLDLRAGTSDVRLASINKGSNLADFAILVDSGSTTPNERLRITSSGNVGIGITSPTQLLDVNGVGLIQTRLTVGNTTEYDTQGDIIAYGSGKNMLIIQTSDNSLDRGLAFRNSGGAYIGYVAITDAGSNLGDMIFGVSDVTETFVDSVDERMRITASGNVGIGTTSPSALLHANGSAIFGGTTTSSRRVDISAIGLATFSYGDNSISSPITLQNLAGDAAADHGSAITWRLATNTSATAINAGRISVAKQQVWTSTSSTQDSYMAFSTTLDGTMAEKMRITDVGNIGVGVTAPISKLHSRITSSSSALLLENTTGGGGAYVDLDFSSYNVSQAGYANAPATIRVIDDAGFSGHITFRTKGNTISAVATEKVRITSAGNVGIGTTSPAAKLDVVGERIRVTAGAIGVNVTVGNRDLQICGFETVSTSGRSGFVNRIPNNFSSVSDNAGFMHLFPFDDNYDAYAFRSSIGSTLSDTFWVKQRGDAYFSGNVGIGTTSPTSKLVVSYDSSSTTTPGIQLENSNSQSVFAFTFGGTQKGRFRVDNSGNMVISPFGGDLYYGSDSSGNINHRFFSNSSERMRIAANGWVGVGTSSPIQKLHVEDGSVFIGDSTYPSGGAASGTYSGYTLRFDNTYNGRKIIMHDDGSSWIGGFGISGGDVDYFSGGNHRFYTGSGPSVNGTERFTILSTGNVGIGTVAPTATLHVQGTILANSTIQYQSPNAANIITSTMYNGGTLSFEGNTGQLFSITDSMSGSIFSVNDISGIPSIEVFDTGEVRLAEYSGNVGIGVTNPQEKLEVSGSIKARELISNLDDSYYISPAEGGYVKQLYFTESATANGYIQIGENYIYGVGPTGSEFEFKNNGDSFIEHGRLGIGLKVPTSNLHVVGTANITSNVIVNGGTFFVDAVGNEVGIGTTTPTHRLTVYGTGSETSPILGLLAGKGSTTINDGSQIAFGYNGLPQYMHFVHTRHNSSLVNNSIDIYVSNGTQFNNVTSGSVHVMSLNGGNVGIGTLSPSSNLHVIGTANVSANLTVGAGSASSPSITTAGDNNTGMFFPAADTIAFAEGGSEVMRIDANGQVGIGTSAPENSEGWGRVLSVYSSGTAKIIANTSAVQVGLWAHNSGFYGAPTGGITGTRTNNPLSIITNGARRITVTADGNVAIGANTTSAKLDVVGRAKANDVTVHSTSASAQLRIKTADATTGYGVLHRHDGSDYYVLLTNNNDSDGAWNGLRPLSISVSGGNLYAGNSTFSVLHGATTGAGAVGVGTASPAYLLDVNRGATGSGLRVSVGQSNTNSNLFTVDQFGGGNRFNIRGNGEFIFANTTNTNVYIAENGNVGIGTTSPAEKLDVRGNVYIGGANTGPNFIAFRGTTGDQPGSYNNTFIGERIWSAGTEKSELFLFKGNDHDAISGPDRIRLAAGEFRVDTYTTPISGSFETVANNANLLTRLTIANTGNVGIGTTTPVYKLEVNGSFAATTKSFVIDHPTQPGKKLRYGSLEGPENGVYVRGKLSGNNSIELPEHWTGLVHEDSITVNLTPIGKHQDLYVEKIENNMIHVKNSALFSNEINCFYTVFAERKDVEKLIVEY